MREQTKFHGKCEGGDEMPESLPGSATAAIVAAEETQQIMSDNLDAKKALAVTLESSGLSREAAARLLNMEIEE